MDLAINILLTLLGYFPGHIHAYYIEFVYFKRREAIRNGTWDGRRAGGVYSERVQRGGLKGDAVPVQGQQGQVPVQQGQATVAPVQYGQGQVGGPAPVQGQVPVQGEQVVGTTV